MSTKKHIIALSVRRQSGTRGALCMDPRNDVHELALDLTKLCHESPSAKEDVSWSPKTLV